MLTLTYNGSSISHNEGSFNFGSKVTDVQYSRDGLTRYAIADAGGFYRDTGAGFTPGASGLPYGQYFYGNCILVHATTPGTICSTVMTQTWRSGTRVRLRRPWPRPWVSTMVPVSAMPKVA